MEKSKTIDTLFAQSLLKTISDPHPRAEATLAALMEAAREGHLCLRVEDPSILPQELVEQMQSDDRMPKKPLCLFRHLLYLQKNWLFETRFLCHVKRLAQARPFLEVAVIKEDPELNEGQNEALKKALTSSIFILTGGPGTGKTFVAAKILRAFWEGLDPSKKEKCRIAITAPTGKAVAQLQKMAPQEIPATRGTLHALLGIRTSADLLEEGRVLEYDFIIVDEASMVDARLFSCLLSSVKEGARLILMGDKDQLPPVDSGSLFADLIEVEMFPKQELNTCVRTESVELLQLAHAANKGMVPEVLAQLGGKFQADVGFAQGTPEIIYEKLWHNIAPKFAAITEEKPSDVKSLKELERFRVLSCLRSGPLGVDALNAWLVKLMYSRAMPREWISMPVLITRNDLTRGLFNGQMGMLLHQVQEKKMFPFHPSNDDVVVFHDRTRHLWELSNYEFAFFLSVHKSQGSEYDEVLLLAPQGSENFGREVLYTAITRARKKLSIDGNLEVIKKALQTSSLKRSGLSLRMR
jgi:exodeoxyribonuclease V alpha subunit